MALIHRIFNKTILTRDCPQILFYDFMALQIPRTLITQPEVNCYGRIMQTLAICISGISWKVRLGSSFKLERPSYNILHRNSNGKVQCVGKLWGYTIIKGYRTSSTIFDELLTEAVLWRCDFTTIILWITSGHWIGYTLPLCPSPLRCLCVGWGRGGGVGVAKVVCFHSAGNGFWGTGNFSKCRIWHGN